MFSASGHVHKAQFPATFALPLTCLKYQFCFHGCFSSCEEILIPESRKFLLVECRIGDIIACGIPNPRIWVLDSLYNMRDFIRGLREDELPLFLRFVTGQDILPHQPIRLMFNRLEGILRRPIAHTCSNLLELSLCYETIQQFSREFKVILCDPASYVMDSASGADLGGGCRGCAPPPTSEMTCGFLIQLVFWPGWRSSNRIKGWLIARAKIRNPVFWLVNRAGKVGLSGMLIIAHFIPQV